MKLYTIQMGQWRVAQKRNIPLINTTVMSGLKWLAPTWDMVKNHKAKIFTDQDYIARWIPLMILSQCDHPEKWKALVDMDVVAIACYCPHGAFCHRQLLVNDIRQYCEKEGVEFTYMGELLKEAA